MSNIKSDVQLAKELYNKKFDKFLRIRLLTLFFIVLFNSFINQELDAYNKQTNGTIVVFNGTSSAGKSSIIKKLLPLLNNRYINLNGDIFLNDYCKKHPLPIDATDQESIEYASNALCALYAHAKGLSLQGKNVLVDIVRFDDEYEKYSKILGTNKVIKILVYCPLDIIFQHVRQRNESGKSEEQRTTALAFHQFVDIYRIQKSESDYVIDRKSTHQLKALLEEARKEAHENVKKLPKEEAIKELTQFEQFYHQFIDKYQLKDAKEIALVPCTRWDLVIKNGVNSLEKVVKVIAQYLHQAESAFNNAEKNT